MCEHVRTGHVPIGTLPTTVFFRRRNRMAEDWPASQSVIVHHAISATENRCETDYLKVYGFFYTLSSINISRTNPVLKGLSRDIKCIYLIILFTNSFIYLLSRT